MRRTSILVDPRVMTELEQLARREGRSTAHLIREAMERYVAAQSQPRDLPGFVGIGRGPGDVAERAEEILEQELRSHVAADAGPQAD
jgi:hypothetical protein